MDSSLKQIIVLLAIAVLAVTLLMRLRLPPILGYLLTGLLVGPYGLDSLKETQGGNVRKENARRGPGVFESH